MPSTFAILAASIDSPAARVVCAAARRMVRARARPGALDVAPQEAAARGPRLRVRITTRPALNRLRTLARRREVYVGPWLPEPLLTVPDVADVVIEPVWVNGEGGLAIREAGVLTAVATAVVEDGVVTTMHIVRNPDKLVFAGPVHLVAQSRRWGCVRH
jgi:hypothetical protein